MRRIVTTNKKSLPTPMTELEAILVMQIRGFRRISRTIYDNRIVEVWAKKKKDGSQYKTEG
jgi:hypothetical protein